MLGQLKVFERWETTRATVWSVSPSKRARRNVVITYSVNRRPFSTELRSKLPFAAGQVFPLRYDPAKPARNELSVREGARKVFVLSGVLAGLLLVFGLTFVPFQHAAGRSVSDSHRAE